MIVVDIDKAFQSFFNDWVEKEADRQLAKLPNGGRRGDIRHEVRDEGLRQIRSRIDRVLDDRFEMVKFENP